MAGGGDGVDSGSRRHYLAAIYGRYRQARQGDKGRILDEFCQVTGYHRKYALRRLNAPVASGGPRRRRRSVTYGPAVVEALRVIWEAAGYPWSVRLKVALPLWLPWARRHQQLSAAVCAHLTRISARQIDRRLAAVKRTLKRRRYGRTRPGTLLKHHITVKTDHWDVTTPGCIELDLVAHCGSRGDGEFVHSLNVTDIHTRVRLVIQSRAYGGGYRGAARPARQGRHPRTPRRAPRQGFDAAGALCSSKFVLAGAAEERSRARRRPTGSPRAPSATASTPRAYRRARSTSWPTVSTTSRGATSTS
jgi:hypothetical protein